MYPVIVRLCRDARSLLKLANIDEYDCIIAHGCSINITRYEISWLKNGALHRIGDLPAVIGEDYLYWYINGELHREDGPAVMNRIRTHKYPHPDIYNSISDTYYKNGKRHRDGDLPALVDLNESRLIWYKNGKPHRDIGPASVVKNSSAIFYKDGQCHRDGDLPAYVCKDDVRMLSWYKDGIPHRDAGPASYYAGPNYSYIEYATRGIVAQRTDDSELLKTLDDENMFVDLKWADINPEDYLVGWKEGLRTRDDLLSVIYSL